MKCVCGHPRDSHKPIVMSVPLEATKPALYPVKAGHYGNNIATIHPHSSYESVECGCGCQTYEADHAG